MAGIKIKWLSDVADALRGNKAVKDSLDDVVDAIEDVASETSDLGRERGVGKLEDSLDDATRQAKELGDAGKRAGDDVDRGMDKAKRGVDDFKSEANQTARESAASFDGSADSIKDSFQEVAANAFSGFGPAGAVAGIAAAAGIGLATQAFVDAEEKRQELEDRATDLAQAYIDAGGKVVDAFAGAEKAQEVIGDPDKTKQVQAYADALGVDFSVALGAYVGRAEDVEAVQGKVNDALEKNSDLAGDNANALSTARAELGKTYQENQNLIDSGNELIGVTTRAGEIFDTYSSYLSHVAETTAGATSKVDEFGDTVVTLPDGKEIYIDAETGQATDNVDAIEKKIYSVPDKTATVTVNVQDNATAQMNGILARLQGHSVTVGVGTVLKDWP